MAALLSDLRDTPLKRLVKRQLAKISNPATAARVKKILKTTFLALLLPFVHLRSLRLSRPFRARLNRVIALSKLYCYDANDYLPHAIEPKNKIGYLNEPLGGRRQKQSPRRF